MLRPLAVLSLLLALAAGPSPAQSASRYLPMADWRMDYLEHLIRTRVIVDPDPLTRPLRVADVLSALRRADTARAPESVRATVRLLTAGLDSMESEPIYRNDMWAGVDAESQARRDPVRDAGSSFFTGRAGMYLSATFGPFVASSGPYFDRRMRYDPNYTGDTTQRIPGRWNDSYLSIQGKYAEVTFGAMDRNWGPPGVDGVMVSAEPYSYDHLYVRVGTPIVRFETLVTRLEDYDTPVVGVIGRRWWIAQRAVVHPLQHFRFAFGQGTLLVGPNRSPEPWWLNPFKISTFTLFDENAPDSSNTLVSGDFLVDLPSGWQFQGTLMVDDFTLDPQTAPNRMGGTVVVDGPLTPAVNLRLAYEMASSLAYRSQEGPQYAITRNRIGLGRNYDDYDETTLSATVLASPGVLLTPQVALLRQGEGTIGTPFTLPATTTPFLFEGVMERTWVAGLAARATVLRDIDVSGHAAIHEIANAGHVAGASASRFVGGITVTYRFGGRVRLDF